MKSRCLQSYKHEVMHLKMFARSRHFWLLGRCNLPNTAHKGVVKSLSFFSYWVKATFCISSDWCCVCCVCCVVALAGSLQWKAWQRRAPDSDHLQSSPQQFHVYFHYFREDFCHQLQFVILKLLMKPTSDFSRVHYWHTNCPPQIYLIALVLHPSIACLKCTVATHSQHTWGNIPPGKPSISFMSFSGKVSSSPIKPLPSPSPPPPLPPLNACLDSFSYISICISFASHLRAIHSGQLPSAAFCVFAEGEPDRDLRLDTSHSGTLVLRLHTTAFRLQGQVKTL